MLKEYNIKQLYKGTASSPILLILILLQRQGLKRMATIFLRIGL